MLIDVSISQSPKKKDCSCKKCDLLEKRINDLIKRIEKTVPHDETAMVIHRKATFQTLQMGMRYMISADGLIQSLENIEKQEGNIITLKGTEIDFLTIHIF